jgi:hypothetical protein
MAAAEFSVHLGGGLYMDSTGKLSNRAEPGKPVYPTPGGGLPFDAGAIAKAFQGIAKVLPDKDDPKSREKFDKILDGIGMAAKHKENLIGVLQAAGAVASVISSVVPVVGVALAVLTSLLGLFKGGPSPFEVMVARRFDDLARQAKSLEIQITQRDLRSQRGKIDAALAAVANYLFEMTNTPPDATALLLRQQDTRGQVANAGLAVRDLLDATTWLATFDHAEHENVWPWIAHRLQTFPTAGPPLVALYPPQGSNQFDHRLMVPMAIYAITSYLTLLRGLTPEFRSTRQNREDLWDFADKLEVLAENMRRTSLARTVYTAANFDASPSGLPWGLDPGEVVDLSVLGFPPRLASGSTRFAVGALDLIGHDDAFFTPTFSASSIQHPGPQNAKQGLLDVRWIPPATLEAYEVPKLVLGWEPANQPAPTERRYRITNPQVCAQAANALAEQAHVDLLYSSGYFNLIHLIATLRNEATDPDHSQTVRSESWLRRKAGPSASVTVESLPILFTGVITAVAQRQSQQYKATAWFTTQPLGRERKLHYRILLRTLGASYSTVGGSWQSETRYESYHQISYGADPARPGFQRLSTSTGVALAELKLAEGQTIDETRQSSGTAVLQAVTFDWWIPVKPLGFAGSLAATVAKDASLRATGWETPGGGSGSSAPAGSGVSAGGGAMGGNSASLPPLTSGVAHSAAMIDDVAFTDYIGWSDGAEPPSGRHRLARTEEIRIDYTLKWQADRLTVTLANNRQQDRNYIVYVVVEETLGSGEILHTVQRVPVTGQLTYVPQSFFDEEAIAHAKTARFFRDFAARYAKSIRDLPRPPGPGDPDPAWNAGAWLGIDRERLAADPVLQQIQRADFTQPQQMARLAVAAFGHEPAARVLRPLMAQAGLSETALTSTLRQLDAEFAEAPRERPDPDEKGDVASV